MPCVRFSIALSASARSLASSTASPRPTISRTNGQVERMNRPLKDAIVNMYSDQIHHHLKEPLQAFLMAYNVAKRLKTLKVLFSIDGGSLAPGNCLLVLLRVTPYS